MSGRKLDRKRPFATVHGEATYRYEQDGRYFGHDEDDVTASVVSPDAFAEIEGEKTPEAMDLEELRARYEELTGQPPDKYCSEPVLRGLVNAELGIVSPPPEPSEKKALEEMTMNELQALYEETTKTKVPRSLGKKELLGRMRVMFDAAPPVPEEGVAG